MFAQLFHDFNSKNDRMSYYVDRGLSALDTDRRVKFLKLTECRTTHVQGSVHGA